jgi:hypothetical protein
MRRIAALALFLAASRALAGPIGAGDPQAASATGFPGAFMGSFALSLADDARYGSRLLDALDEHLQAVGVMTGPREISDYLEQSAGGSDGVSALRASLGHEAVDPMKAGALLLADALARPGQLREILEDLESAKPGVGRHAAQLLRAARGAGDKKLFAALHAAGGPRLDTGSRPYYGGGKLASIFDAATSSGRDGISLDDPAAAPPAGAPVRPRASDLSRAARP